MSPVKFDYYPLRIAIKYPVVGGVYKIHVCHTESGNGCVDVHTLTNRVQKKSYVVSDLKNTVCNFINLINRIFTAHASTLLAVVYDTSKNSSHC